MIEVQKIPFLLQLNRKIIVSCRWLATISTSVALLELGYPTPLTFPRDGLLCEQIEIETTSTMILSLGLFPLLAFLVITFERCGEDFLWEVNGAMPIELDLETPAPVNKV